MLIVWPHNAPHNYKTIYNPGKGYDSLANTHFCPCGDYPDKYSRCRYAVPKTTSATTTTLPGPNYSTS
jgi:hypothetical protein